MTLNLTHFSGPSVVSILVDVPVVLITWAITIRHRLIAWIRAACHFQLMLLLAWNTLSTLLLRPNSHMDQWRNFKFWAPRKETNWALLFFVPMAKAKGACKLLCKKILLRILGPLGPWAPPHCGVCGVTIYATDMDNFVLFVCRLSQLAYGSCSLTCDTTSLDSHSIQVCWLSNCIFSA